MSATSSPLHPPTRTILLVEDEDPVREITRHVLERAGYLVLEASSAEQAMVVFRRFEGTIHLLLTDVVMPSTSGIDLAAQLKTLRPGFITMFMSGYSGSAALPHDDFGPPNFYIQKPFSISALLSRVADALSLPTSSYDRTSESRLPI